MDLDRIYMDNAATTAVSPVVLEKMLPFFTELYGNASSIHGTGRDARKALEDARRRVAAVLNCKPNELYFTSGGSESDNWAIKGIAFANRKRGNHIITSSIEHHAVLHTCQWLENDLAGRCRLDGTLPEHHPGRPHNHRDARI